MTITIFDICSGTPGVYEDTPLDGSRLVRNDVFVKFSFVIRIGEFTEKRVASGEGREEMAALRRCVHELFYFISKFEKNYELVNKKPFVPEFKYQLPPEVIECLKPMIDDKLSKYKVNELLQSSSEGISGIDFGVHTIFN